MIYKIEYGLYEGKKETQYFTSLNLPDIDLLYSRLKKRNWINYLVFKEYFPELKTWDFIFSIFR